MVLPSCVESLLLKQNPTLIHLHNVKSFVFSSRSQGSTLSKMGLPRATAFRFFWTEPFRDCFQSLFQQQARPKTGAPNPALDRVAILFLGLRYHAQNAPSCFKSSPETMKPQKTGKMTRAELMKVHLFLLQRLDSSR